MLVLAAPVHAAERCTRYVPITSPCAGIGGPRSRIVAGRAAVPALATCRAELDAERKLRTVDARAAVAQLALLESQGAADIADRVGRDRIRGRRARLRRRRLAGGKVIAGLTRGAL